MNPREIRECKEHGLTVFVLREAGKRWRCMKCNSNSVCNRRRAVKTTLVLERGAVCSDCGYRGPPFMFDFDHRDPNDKSFGLSSGHTTKGIEKLRKEASKCDLVCSNCHRMRTHKQRCPGCEYCLKEFVEILEQEKRKPGKYGGELVHGTSMGYNVHKCRCDLCKKYKSISHLNRKK